MTNAQARARKIDERVRGENGRWYAPNCPPGKHGTLTGVTYWMCQCDPCVKALRDRTRERKAEREHNLKIIARLAAEREASTLPPPQGPPAPEREESATQRTEIAGREQQGNDEPPDVVDSQENVRLVEMPAADSPSPGPIVDGLPVPVLTAAARAAVEDVDHLIRIVHAYHDPSITMPMPLGRQRRIGRGVVLVVDGHGVVAGIDQHEPAAGPSELLRDRGPARRYGKRGPSGTRNPTSWAELHDRLEELGCTIEPGSTHPKVRLPDGRVTTLPSTASDWRALPNMVSQLRQLGLDVRRTS